MTRFVLLSVDKPNAAVRRKANMQAHLDYIAANKDLLKVGGPVQNDDGVTVGSLIIFEAADWEAAEKFRVEDPFAKAELFEYQDLRRVGGNLDNL